MRLNFLSRLIIWVLVFAAIFAVVQAVVSDRNRDTGFFLKDYLDDERGLPLYSINEDGNTDKAGYLNLGQFYRDILKIGGDREIISACSETDEFSKCLEEAAAAVELQEKYDRHMKNIKQAALIGEEHGIRYLDVPFVRDFLE